MSTSSAPPAVPAATGGALRARATTALRSATSVTAATQVVTLGATLVSSVLLARALGADGRGDVAAVMTTLTLLSWVVFLGVPNAAGYLSSTARSAVVSTAAVLATALGVAAGALVWVLAPGFLSGHSPDALVALRVGAVALPLTGLGLCGLEIAYAEQRAVVWNVLRSVPLVGPSLAILVVSAVGELDLRIVLTAYLGSSIVCAAGGAVLLVTRAGGRPAWQQRGAVLRYALPRWLSASSDAVTARLDQVVMVALASPPELGRYAVAVTAVGVSNPLSAAIGMMLYPRSRNASGAQQASLIWRAARRRSLVLSATTGLALSAVGPWLVPALFGPDFRGLGLVIVVLVLGQVLSDRWSVDVSYFGGTGRPELTVAPAAAGAVATGVGLLALGLSGGLSPLEAAAMTLLGNCVRAGTLRWRSADVERRAAEPVPPQAAHGTD